MKKTNCCNTNISINQIKENIQSKDLLDSLSRFYKVFGDQTRLSILFSLKHGELCVNTLSDILGMSQSSISHQLRILKDAKLVKSRREGKYLHYSLDDDHIEKILSLGLDHMKEGIL